MIAEESRPRTAASSSGTGNQFGSSSAMVLSGADASPLPSVGLEAARMAPQAMMRKAGSVAPKVAHNMDAAPEPRGLW